MTTIRVTPNKPAATRRTKGNGVPVILSIILPLILAILLYVNHIKQPPPQVLYENPDSPEWVAIDLQSSEYTCGFVVNDTHEIWSASDLAPHIYPQHKQFLQDAAHDPFPHIYSKTIFEAVQRFSRNHYNKTHTGAVIAIPSHFNDSERQAIKDMAAEAGFTEQRLMKRQTAASVAYDLDKGYNEDYVLVYDLNKNHVDVSLLVVEDGVFEILGHVHKTNLGFNEIRERLVEHIINEYDKRLKDGMFKDKEVVESLRKAVELTFAESSPWTQAIIDIPLPSNKGFHRLHSTALHKLSEPILKSMISLTQPLFAEVKLPAESINYIILTGSPISFPLHTSLTDIFSSVPKPPKIHQDLAAKAVLQGAIRQARVMSGDDGVSGCPMFDVVPLSIGIETTGGAFTKVLIRNSITPNRRSERFKVLLPPIADLGEERDEVVIKVFEGERMFTADNKYLGELRLEKLRRGDVILEVQITAVEKRDLDVEVLVTDVTYESHGKVIEEAKLAVDVLLQHRRSGEVDAVLEDAEKNYEDDMKRLEELKLAEEELRVNELVHIVRDLSRVEKVEPTGWFGWFWWLRQELLRML